MTILAVLQAILTALQNLASTTSGTTGSGRASATGSGCCPGGTTVPPEEFDGGPTPPTGYSEPTGGPAGDTRQCKVANLIVDYLINTIDRWIAAGVQTIINTLGILAQPILFAVVAGGLAFVITPGFILDDIIAVIVGLVAGIVSALTVGSVDIDVLKQAIVNNRQELVCALFEAGSVEAARSDVDDVMQTAGVSAANRALLAAMLAGYIINLKWFNPDELAVGLEQALDGYTSPTSCDACGCGPAVLVYGTLQSGDMGSDFTIDAIQRSVGGATFYEAKFTAPAGCCVEYSWSMSPACVSGCANPQNNTYHQRWICGDPSATLETPNTCYPSSGQYCLEPGQNNFWRSCNTFTLTVTRLTENCT